MIKTGMKKKIAIMLILALTLLAASVTVNAQMITKHEAIGIQPFWINTSLLTVSLSFDNGKGALYSQAVGYTGTTKITGNAVLERKNTDGTYTEISRWSNLSANTEVLVFSSDYYVTKGYTYRLTFTATVYKNGIGETVSGSKTADA